MRAASVLPQSSQTEPICGTLGIAPRHREYGPIGGETPVRFLHEAAGRSQDALTAYARILTIDPLHFEAHEALIAFLVARDRLDDAQQRWERYARAYGGVPPFPAPRP